MKNPEKILVTIYIHPEYYPPTLNAISEFSRISSYVSVVSRNLVKSDWEFPENVNVRLSGKYVSLADSTKQSFFKKTISFYYYLKLLYQSINQENPDIIVAYDSIALFACWILNKLSSKRIYFWYHNHDRGELKNLSQFSIYRFAERYEQSALKMVDILTIPSKDRAMFFSLDKLKGSYYVLPNLPLRSFYKQFYNVRQAPGKNVKMLYQGAVGEGHGLEEIIEILNESVASRSLSLTLLGNVKQNYKNKLIQIAEKHNVRDRLSFLPRESYLKLARITRRYDIGIAILKPININFETAGFASNKIYEYAALGLPVILYDHEQYKKYLIKFKWAYFTRLSSPSIISCIENIVLRYDELSKQAHNDFLTELNFENYFGKIIQVVGKNESFRIR